MNKFIRKDKLCRICDSSDIVTILKLNNTPLEDQFVDESNKHIEQKTYPLELAICNHCGYVYLPHVINPEESYVDYLYKSGITPGLRSHYDEYAKKIVSKYNIKKDSLIVDLGSNDGSMLASFKKQGMNILGVEPAKLIAEHANQAGVETINDFFTDEVVSKILSNYGKADVISANYMFANIDNIIQFTKSVESLLSKNGSTTGVIKEVYCAVPHNEKKPWKVYLKVKSVAWPFDRIKRIEIFKIFDQLLSEEVTAVNYFHGN